MAVANVARRRFILAVFCLLPRFSLQQTTGSVTAGDELGAGLLPVGCQETALQDGITEWNERTMDIYADVEWGYGNMTCSSMNQCFGLSLDNDVALEAQLKPIQIQEGEQVRFISSPNMDVQFRMSVFRVEENDFRSCDLSKGTPLTNGPQAGEFIVLEKYLTPGTNYFIANTTNHLYTCKYGLRLNVTVRTEDCSPLGQTQLCNNRGRCVANSIQPQFECSCCAGYTGHYCEETDACASSPCLNDGTCSHVTGGQNGSTFSCQCRLGYYGDTCEKHVDNLCDTNPCANNGTCVANERNFTCICAHGYTGYHCEVDINNCADNPCVHGVCVDELDKYKCFCTPGYGGLNCERQFDECQSNPCRNNGFCIDLQDGFECHCSRGYTGKDCSIKVDLCNPSPCLNATKCIDLGHDFVCTCRPGFTGAHCEININECASNPCRNGGICRDITAGYRCLCPEGVSGTHCEYKRLDLPRLPTHDSIYRDSNMSHLHVNNLYIVAGTLAGALLIALSVLAGCYCKVHETYRIFYNKTRGYSRQHNDVMRRKRDYSARQVACHLDDPRPSIDAILEATSVGYDDNTLNAPLVSSLKPKRV